GRPGVRPRHRRPRRARRAGDAVRQRITAPDVRAREAGTSRRDLDGRLGDRLRSGIHARGVERSERRRALVERALAVDGVLDDLLDDAGPHLTDGLDALDLAIVAALPPP